MENTLKNFFSPRGVALIGASANPGKLSYGILRNLTQYGYQGAIYPVNPSHDEILDLKCYPDISNVPQPVDLAVIVLPAQIIPAVIEGCGKQGVKTAIIISGGFKEVGAKGAELEKQCLEIARNYDMRLIGPNCVGTMDFTSGLNTTFIQGIPDRGGIGFISQSGAVGGGVVDYISNKGVGFSHFVSLGNEADVNETDMIEYLAEDPGTTVIAAYVEAIRDGRRFVDVAQKVTRDKPIVLLKAGRTPAGARAVSSHTGSLAGSQAAYGAALQQSGVIEVQSVAALFEVAMALDYQPLPLGNSVAILTNAGGPAALASDSLATNGMSLGNLEADTKSRLREHLNYSAQVENPVDMLGGAEPHEYAFTLQRLLDDQNVDAVLAILVPQALVDPAEVARAIGENAKGSTKPVIACFMGEQSIGAARTVLHSYHIPMYVFPESVGKVLGSMYCYGQWLEQPVGTVPPFEKRGRTKVQALFQGAFEKTHLGEAETRPFLEAYGIPVVRGEIAKTPEEALQIAQNLGYPVVLKIVSENILHKSDAGGIRLGIGDDSALKAAYGELIHTISVSHPDAKLDGILVEAMAPRGQEVIVGMKRDPSFGPLMMFGFGGIYVELFKDVGFRIAPVARKEASDMILQTQSGKLLMGFRGQPAADIDAVIDCIQRLGQMALDFPQIEEVEVNPLLVLSKGQGAVALDCRMILNTADEL